MSPNPIYNTYYTYNMVLTVKGTTNPSVPTLRNFEGLAVTVVRKATQPVNALPSPKERVLIAVKKGMYLVSLFNPDLLTSLVGTARWSVQTRGYSKDHVNTARWKDMRPPNAPRSLRCFVITAINLGTLNVLQHYPIPSCFVTS